MTITVKGQVTIPQAMRERFGLLPGTEVDFVPTENGVEISPVGEGQKIKSAGQAWLEMAAGSLQTDLTTDQIMESTRGEG